MRLFFSSRAIPFGPLPSDPEITLKPNLSHSTQYPESFFRMLFISHSFIVIPLLYI